MRSKASGKKPHAKPPAPHSPAHKKVVTRLIRDIYEQKLKPGEKLPPLRELSKQLKADQTSVRIALKHLEFMRVVEIKRSDGVYIRDFRANAGPEFILALFPAPGEKDLHIDEYLIDEVFEYWMVFSPELIRRGWGRYSMTTIKELLDIYDRELGCLADVPKLVALEMRLMDILTEAADNIMLTLTMNSLRQLNERMIEVVVRSVGPDILREIIRMRRDRIRGVLGGAVPDPDDIIGSYRREMELQRQCMRKAMADRMAAGARKEPRIP